MPMRLCLLALTALALVGCGKTIYRPLNASLTDQHFYQANFECQQHSNNVRQSEINNSRQQASIYSDPIAQNMFMSTAGAGAGIAAESAYRSCMAAKGWVPE